MVDFGTDYWGSMDKEQPEKINLSTKNLGISMGIGDPWSQIKAAITAGASSVELGFMGMGKGSISSPMSITPGTIGKEKREDIRQLAKINNVKLTTHASANAMGFSGLSEGRFSNQAAEQTMREVKRAIDFAADTAEGGPVVLHTGEFPRAVSDVGGKFSMYEKEAEEALAGIVDGKTGEIIQTFKRNIKVPILQTMKDNDGNDVIDPNTGQPVPMVDKQGRYRYEDMKYTDYEEKLRKDGLQGNELREKATKEFFEAFSDKQMLQVSSEEKRWQGQAEKMKKNLEEIKNRVDSVKDQADINPQMANYWAMQYAAEMGTAPRQGSPEYQDFLNNPMKYLEKGVKEMRREYDYMREAAVSYGKQRKELKEKLDTAETLQEYAIKKSSVNIAKLGMYAFTVEKKKGLKKPVYISPENIFAESYGSHPQELKNLILEARKKMTQDLLDQKKVDNKKEAKKLADNHIKATFDIGHANLWRQYFKGSDKEFKKWLMTEVKDLVKHKVIGHVHISDNFGYGDEHLAPGQGNTPIKEFIKEIEKAGLKDEIIIEPGAQGEGESIYGVMTEGWAGLAASPMYRVGPVSRSWTDIEGSYFGRTNSTTLMQGQYLPLTDKADAWWSETPIE